MHGTYFVLKAYNYLCLIILVQVQQVQALFSSARLISKGGAESSR
jgi:hypothetical protein